MVQIIPKASNFGEEFGKAIGQGAGTGMEEGLQERKQKAEQLIENNSVKSFAKQIREQYPNSKQHQLIASIYEQDAPYELKSKMINDLIGVDPFKKQQQDRLLLDVKRKLYDSKIKEVTDQLKNYHRPDEKKVLEDHLRNLQKERDLLFFGELEEDQEESKGVQVMGQKPNFDPSNPEHQAKAQQLFDTFGDREKVRKKLRKEFDHVDIE